MKITAIKAISLKCTCPPISDALQTSTSRQALLVKIETDSGLYGIGEAFTYGTPLPIMSYIIENHLGPMILDKNPEYIEELWNLMYWRTIAHGRRSVILAGISGIDIALWDLLGKAYHLPVYKLLGAASDKVRTYASGGFYAPDKDINQLTNELESYLKKGYRDAKIKIGRNRDRASSPLKYMADQNYSVTVLEDITRMEAARTVLGDGKLMVDSNAAWNADTTVLIAPELRRLGVYWLEEPIPFEDLEGLKKIKKAVPDILIAGFETQQGLKNFQTMVNFNVVDILQPDIGWAGGFTECRKIGAMAEAAGRNVSLHCFGSAVLFAASLHLAASLPNAEMLESEENPNPLKTDIIKSPFETDQSMNFFVPQKEGLGIDLDFTSMEQYSIINQ